MTFSTLYPNAALPNHGVFVERRLRFLVESGQVQARVIAPTPWFPSSNPRMSRYSIFARAPRSESRYDILIEHPRYLVVPKVGMTAAPFLLAAGAMRSVNDMIEHGYNPDVIDAHYFYPDGVAAAIIGKKIGKPVVITARGSDINLLARYALPRRMIQWAARRASALITVSAALKNALVKLGVNADNITVLRNGVDTKLFTPSDQSPDKLRCDGSGPLLLMVGNLVPLKGHDLVLRALVHFPRARLLVIGEGGEEVNLKMLADNLQIKDRVSFMGPLSQHELPKYYSAVDALVLASSREGWPNVLLESMACGTPVVATQVGGIPEIVASPEAGVLVAERSVEGIVQGLNRLFQTYPDRKLTRKYAERFGWEDTTRGQLEIFDRVIRGAG